MLKKINKVSQLPEWFDIEPYNRWHDIEPITAALAVRNRLDYWLQTRDALNRTPMPMVSDVVLHDALKWVEKTSKDPFDIHRQRPPIDWLDPSVVEYNALVEAAELEEIVTFPEEIMSSKLDDEASKLLGADGLKVFEGDVRHVTLFDVMGFMRRNKEFIDRAEAYAHAMSEKHGWPLEMMRDAVFQRIPLRGEINETFLSVHGNPTIEAELQGIRRYLVKNYSSKAAISKVKPSEVRKLFQYRIAAYANLQAWACLTRSHITQKCMAEALFPANEVPPSKYKFEGNDLSPARPLGNFINKLTDGSGYLYELLSKASETESFTRDA